MKTRILTFNKEEDGNWYIDLPNWPFAHHNLMMVAGADDLCEHLSGDGKTVSIEILLGDLPEKSSEQYGKLQKIDSSLMGGATYKVTNIPDFTQSIWLCPVTLFVFGKYPEVMYIKKEELYKNSEEKEIFEEIDNYIINHCDLI